MQQVATRHIVPKNDDTLRRQLGSVVREHRQRLGLTQEELAWRANLHRTYITDIERGARNVTLKSVASLAKAFQTTVCNLFSDIGAAAEEPVSRRRCGGDCPDVSRAILMIEDDAADAELAMRAFRQVRLTNPLQVLGDAESGLDRLFGEGRWAKQGALRPQVILLDLNLPGMSGQDFLRRVKADARTRDIPVVILTVSRNDRVILECSRLGAAHFIVKPVGLENFIRITPRLNLHLTLAPPAGGRAKPVSA